jgi:hypothetical protein
MLHALAHLILHEFIILIFNEKNDVWIALLYNFSIRLLILVTFHYSPQHFILKFVHMIIIIITTTTTITKIQRYKFYS